MTFAGDEEAPCRLWADGARLAIENVVRNAVRHGRSSDGRADVTITVDAGRRSVTVEDRGPGILAGDRARLVKPFERGSTSSPGSGLGLAFADRVAHAHGGTLIIEDAPTGGSRITLAFG